MNQLIPDAFESPMGSHFETNRDMLYSMRFMNRKILFAALSVLISCGILPNQAADVVNDFYEYQHSGSVDFPKDMFVSMEVAVQTGSLLSQKKMIYGSYISHNRIGTSRHISIGENGKREIITYTCMVTGEQGRTQETLMLERYGTSEPFRITAYVIEEIPVFHESPPGDTA